MPTAGNSARPKILRMPLDRKAAKLLNKVQALMLTGREDTSVATAVLDAGRLTFTTGNRLAHFEEQEFRL